MNSPQIFSHRPPTQTALITAVPLFTEDQLKLRRLIHFPPKQPAKKLTDQLTVLEMIET